MNWKAGQPSALKTGSRLITMLIFLSGSFFLPATLPPAADLTPGSLDTGFEPGGGANNTVYAAALQSDGRVLIGGTFTQVDGTPRSYIARLKADGTLDTAFDAAPNLLIYAIAAQPDGKIIIGGSFTQVNGSARNRIARLNADGSLDTGFNPGSGANGDNNAMIRTVVLQNDGKILIGGNFTQINGVARARIARLNADGSLDTGFNPGSGANDTVRCIARQPDGKVLIGGAFTQVDGTARARIARLNASGSLDTGFDPGTGANAEVYALALQSDGRALIGGGFTQVDGTAHTYIARLNTDGTPDAGFNPGTGANHYVYALDILDNDKIMLGGWFSAVNGVARRRIARLAADGSLDPDFIPGNIADHWIYTLAVQPNDQVMIGGSFTEIDGIARARVARLNADGSLDAPFNADTNALVRAVADAADGKVLIGGTFTQVDSTTRSALARLRADGTLDAGFDPGSGANDTVYAIAEQPDGKVLIGGDFTQINGTARARIARLDKDGTLDTGFDPGTGANGSVYAVLRQPNGKVLIGGDFTQVNSTARARIARLNADGTLDTGFDPGTGANNTIYAITVHPDGKVLIGGDFTQVNGVVRARIARLNANGTLDTGFNPGSGADNTVYAVIAQADGNVLIGGAFTTIDGTTRGHIARLESTGTLDTGFDPGSGANGDVRAVALRGDGRVLIAGNFTQINSTAQGHVARLHSATAPVITSGELPTLSSPGTPYQHTFTASGFPQPTFRVTSGSLPPGLALSAESGLLSGSPTTVGSYPFAVTASNWSAPNATQAITLENGVSLYLPLMTKS